MLRYLGCECQEESRTPLAPRICIQHENINNNKYTINNVNDKILTLPIMIILLIQIVMIILLLVINSLSSS